MELAIKPFLKQYEAWQKWLDKETLFVFLGGGAGGGKSYWIAQKRIATAYGYPGSRAFIGRKELKRLMSSTFVTFTKACKELGVPKSDWDLNGQYNYIQFKNGSRIDLLDLDYKPSDPEYERFGSLEYTEGDVDESPEIQQKAFEVLKSRVGRHKNHEFGIPGKIGLTGNPSKEWPYRVFYKPFRDGTLPREYAFIQALYKDNPITAKIYERQLSSITDKTTKERLMFGNWEYDSSHDALMQYEAIIDLFTNPPSYKEDLYLTVDVARYGQDKTVYAFWRDWDAYEIVERTKLGVDKVAEELRNYMYQRGIPYSHCLVDEDGLGGGVVDILRGVKGFQANAAPFNHENYRNLKAQCAWRFSELVNNHGVSISAELDEERKNEIIADLEQVRSKDIDKDGKRQLKPKEEVKEILGRSPDKGDALIMRAWFDVSGFGGDEEALVIKPGITVEGSRKPGIAHVFKPGL